MKFPNPASGNPFIFCLIFIFLFGLYSWSAPRTVVFEDDGLFILSAYFNGISHPPGYPVYTFLAHLATLIPAGSVAYRVHLLSGLFGALSCLCLWWLVNNWLNDKVLASVSALVFGCSATFWSQAIISEVYTLNVFIFLLLCILAVRWEENRDAADSDRILCWMGFIYGLGISSHWPLLVLSTPMLIALMWHCLRMPAKRFLKPAVFLLLGLIPYAWMVIRSQMDPEISFYGPIESLSEFWFYVSRHGYAEADTNIGAGLIDRLQFLLFTLHESVKQFGYVSSLLILAGIIVQGKYIRKNISWALILGFLGSTVLLILLLGFNYDQIHRNIFKVYPLISYVALAVYLTIGLKFIVDRISVTSSQWTSPGFLKAVMSFLLVASVFFVNLPGNFRAGDFLAEKYSRIVLDTLEKNSIFITYTDIDTGPIGYMHLIENIRPDVLLMNADGFVFSTRLYKATLDLDKKYEIFAEFLRKEDRPVYFIKGIPDLYGKDDFGLYIKLDKSKSNDRATIVMDKVILDYFEGLLTIGDLADPWESMAQDMMLSSYCRISVHLHVAKVDAYSQEKLVRICSGYSSLLVLLDVLIENNYEDTAFLQKQLNRARELENDAIEVKNRAGLEYLYGRLKLMENDTHAAVHYFKKSTDIWPSEENNAWHYLRDLQKKSVPLDQADSGSAYPGTN